MFNNSFEIPNLDGSNGFRITFGSNINSAGDVNGDGINDITIGKHVIFGSDSGFDSTFDLSSLDGSNGFFINDDINDGASNGNFSVLIGNKGDFDLNGDGFDDIILNIDNVYRDNLPTGESYVVFGNDSEFDSSFDLSSLDGSNGLIIQGISSRFTGQSISNAGDFNGDGIDDIVIGTPISDPSFRGGISRVIFGGDSRLTTFSINGEYSMRTGTYTSNAGDVNGDGIDDIIIGSYYSRSYVVFGNSEYGLNNTSLQLSALDGSNGFTLSEGKFVSNAGDVNGDGIDDIVVGGDYNNELSYVVFGRNSGFSPNLDLSSLDGSNGFVINSNSANNFPSSAGDINGDGIDDILINSFYGNESYVVFGNDNGFSPDLDVSSLDGNNGFVLSSRSSISNAGDVNGDGIDDIIVGLSSEGESYVIFGSLDSTAPDAIDDFFTTTEDTSLTTIDLLANDINVDGDSTAITNTDTSATLGLVTDNGDGTFSYDPNGQFDDLNDGETTTDSFTYTIDDGLGNTDSATVTIAIEGVSQEEGQNIKGTSKADTLNGFSGDDTISGFKGNDLVNGNVGDDILRGNRNNDTLNGGLGDDKLFGNNNDDILNGEENDDLLVGGKGNDTLDGGVGNDTLRGNSNNDILTGKEGNDFLNGGSGSDTLNGGVGNDTLKGGSGSDIFALAIGEGVETIRDFQLTQDKIGLIGSLTFAELTLSGNDILSGTETLATLNVATDSLTESHFVGV